MLDEDFMALALAQARLAAAAEEVPIGAVLVLDGEVVASGYNQTIQLNDPTAHAEMQCLRAAGQVLNNYRLINTTLYTTLEPCCMCAGALVHARVKRLVIGATDLKAGACGSVFNLTKGAPLNHRLEVDTNVMSAECGDILSAFFKARRKS